MCQGFRYMVYSHVYHSEECASECSLPAHGPDVMLMMSISKGILTSVRLIPQQSCAHAAIPLTSLS